jgi:MinD-like ATPase involved in chromosome partitioning or flagellar assembly
MSEGAGIKTPKTLADVSHLFFSNVEEEGGEATLAREAAEDGAGAPAVEAADEGERGLWRRTRTFVVTGGPRSPGKSTVAVNLATALTARGCVALFDADPRIPNARFYLGLPSWHYLSPVTGDGTPAPNTVTDSGLIVADWTRCDAPGDGLGPGDLVYADVEGVGRCGLDLAVIDAPISRVDWMSEIAERVDRFLVVAKPGLAGFEEAFGVLALLARRAGVREAFTAINMAPDLGYAASFHAKLSAAAERLLSVETVLLGAVVYEAGLGAEQREHGAIVGSRPDAASALLLRGMAANMFGDPSEDSGELSRPGEGVRAEDQDEREAQAHGAS